jgi:hypothetical protein
MSKRKFEEGQDRKVKQKISVTNLRSYVDSLIPSSNFQNLKIALQALQGAKTFRVLPRLLFTSKGESGTKVYAENELGFYQEIIAKEHHNSINFHCFEDSDRNKYYWDHEVDPNDDKKLVSVFYEASKEGKLQELFSRSGKWSLIMKSGANFVIEETNQIWLVGLENKKYKALTSYKWNWSESRQCYYYLKPNFLIEYPSQFGYAGIIEIKDNKFVRNSDSLLLAEINRDTRTFGDHEERNDFLVINEEEVAIFVNFRLIICKLVGMRSTVIGNFRLKARNGFLIKINSHLFALHDTGAQEFSLYMKERETWFCLQTLPKTENLNKLLVLSPERPEFLEKAKLLKVKLPLELVILVTEFLYDS